MNAYATVLLTLNVGLGILAVVLNGWHLLHYPKSSRRAFAAIRFVLGAYVSLIYILVFSTDLLSDPVTVLTIRSTRFWLRPAFTIMLAILSIEPVYWLAHYYNNSH